MSKDQEPAERSDAAVEDLELDAARRKPAPRDASALPSSETCDDARDCADMTPRDAGPVDPCAECAADATCEVVGGEARCRCNGGFWGDGLTCAPDECAEAEGGGTRCGPNTMCTDPSPSTGDFTCTCASGYTDCDGSQATGCEAHLESDPSHCGACGERCAGDLACAEGTCEQAAFKLAMEGYSVCALLEPSDGSGRRPVACWGLGIEDQTQTHTTPVEPPVLARALDLELGAAHACAITDANTVACWGNNNAYQLGTERNVAPRELVYTRLPQVEEVAGGGAHTCARAAGRVYCWGSNNGTLGVEHSAKQIAAPQQVPGIAGAVQLSASYFMTCARLATGRALCWGAGLGRSPVEIKDARDRSIDDFVHLAAGPLHACGVRATGEVGCWGINSMSQLGSPAGDARQYYAPVSDLRDVVDVAVGAAHSCALTRRGQVYCWGGNSTNQLGAASQPSVVERPVPVSNLADALDIEASYAHTCARRHSGQVTCWGDNAFGQLGDGTTLPSSQPADVRSLP